MRFQSWRPAMASVPVASIWWIGLKRPPNSPFCGPLASSGMPSANTLPVRMRLAALTLFPGGALVERSDVVVFAPAAPVLELFRRFGDRLLADLDVHRSTPVSPGVYSHGGQ